MRTIAGLLLLLAFAPVARAAAQAPVPLEDFFRNATFDDVQISPDGRYISAITRTGKHPTARNLVVMDVGHWDEARLVTSFENEEIRWYDWAGNDRLFFTVDRDYDDVDRGFEYVGFFSVRQDGKAGRTLHRPFDNDDRRSRGSISGKTQRVSGGLREDLDFFDDLPGDPDHVLVGKRDSLVFPDAYRMNVTTGRMTTAAKGAGVFEQWIADNRGRVRAAMGRGETRDDLEYALSYREDEDADWQTVRTFDARTAVRVHGFDVDNRHLWVSARADGDRMALYRLDPESGEMGPAVASDPVYDLDGELVSARDGTPLYLEYHGEKPTKVFLDEDWRRLQETIDGVLPDTYNDFVDWDEHWARFVVHAWSDRDPGTYYFFDREKGTLKQLLKTHGWIDPARLSPMEPIVFEARDGMVIRGYLTRPPGWTEGATPLIVHPHGGPFGIRDVWSYNPDVQFLASRGYAVLQVNYRGSGGYGFNFEAAGYKRWGLEMQDDLTDAVRWAIDQGIADADNVGIYGASYGGYATMMGLVKTPDLYRVGINYVGVVDLPRLYRQDTAPRKFAGVRDWFRNWWGHHVGDPRVDADRLRDTSPIHFVDRIQAPVMVIHGRLDPRVDIDGQYRPLIRALRSEGKTHLAMVKRFEGHGFFKEQNQIELYSAMQDFLAQYMPSELNPGTERVAAEP